MFFENHPKRFQKFQIFVWNLFFKKKIPDFKKMTKLIPDLEFLESKDSRWQHCLPLHAVSEIGGVENC